MKPKRRLPGNCRIKTFFKNLLNYAKMPHFNNAKYDFCLDPIRSTIEFKFSRKSPPKRMMAKENNSLYHISSYLTINPNKEKYIQNRFSRIRYKLREIRVIDTSIHFFLSYFIAFRTRSKFQIRTNSEEIIFIKVGGAMPKLLQKK